MPQLPDWLVRDFPVLAAVAFLTGAAILWMDRRARAEVERLRQTVAMVLDRADAEIARVYRDRDADRRDLADAEARHADELARLKRESDAHLRSKNAEIRRLERLLGLREGDGP